MIEIKFKKCCENCKDRSIYTQEDFFEDRSIFKISHQNDLRIGCLHEKICKAYIDYQEEPEYKISKSEMERLLEIKRRYMNNDRM